MRGTYVDDAIHEEEAVDVARLGIGTEGDLRGRDEQCERQGERGHDVPHRKEAESRFTRIEQAPAAARELSNLGSVVLRQGFDRLVLS